MSSKLSTSITRNIDGRASEILGPTLGRRPRSSSEATGLMIVGIYYITCLRVVITTVRIVYICVKGSSPLSTCMSGWEGYHLIYRVGGIVL